jgi:hypothetical protein
MTALLILQGSIAAVGKEILGLAEGAMGADGNVFRGDPFGLGLGTVDPAQIQANLAGQRIGQESSAGIQPWG